MENIINISETEQNLPEETPVKKIKISDNDLNKFENSSAYRVKLEIFEGPLDLLLYLIRDSKLEIEDIKLSEVTEQYLSFMNELGTIDMERAAEFIDLAATLLEIKSKHLIPQERDTEIDMDDPEQRLLMRLKEYKLFKEASEQLKQIENVNRMYKLPDETVNDFRVVLRQMNVENLITAFTSLLSKVSFDASIELPKTIERERWTVEDKMFEIRTLMQTDKLIKFSDIVEADYTRSEIITLFISLLELLKLQEIRVTQEEQFGEITIVRGENFK